MENLHKYNNNLYFEISTCSDESELIVTAEGDIEYFESVEVLIRSAPDIKDWKFTAFKPPMGFDFVTCYEDVEYDPAHLWFLPLVNPNEPEGLGLRIGIPGYCANIHEHFVAASWIVLETEIGEKAVTRKIKFIETTNLPENPEEEGFIELLQIDNYLKWRNNKKCS